MTKQPRHPYLLPIYVAIGALEGAIAGWLFLGFLIWRDLFGIGRLVANVAEGYLMLWLAIVMFAITFGMLGIAWRVMVLLPGDDT